LGAFFPGRIGISSLEVLKIQIVSFYQFLKFIREFFVSFIGSPKNIHSDCSHKISKQAVFFWLVFSQI
jgi:hypothetical protein